MNTVHKKLTLPVFFLLLATAIGTVWWELVCPDKAVDDFAYSLAIPEGETFDSVPFFNESGEPFENLPQLVESIRGHILSENNRLANVLMFTLVFVPRPPVRVMLGLLIVLMAYLLLRLVAGRKFMPNPLAAVIAIALMWIALPWNDNMQSVDFQLNYVLSSVFFLGAIVCIRGGAKAWKGILLSFLTALNHEAFAVVLAVWLFLTMLLDTDRRRRAACFYSLIAIAVVGVFSLCAGTGTRAAGKGDSLWSWETARYMIIKGLSARWPSFAGLLVLLYKTVRNVRVWRETLPCFCAILTGTLMCSVFLVFGRLSWAPNLLSCIVMARCFVTCDGRGARIIAVGLSAFYILWLGQLVWWQRKTTAAHDMICAQLGRPHSASSSCVFLPEIITIDDIPGWLREIPAPHYFYDRYNSERVGRYYQRDYYPIAVLPDSLADFPPQAWPRVEGNLNARGIAPGYIIDRPFDGFIVLTGSEEFRKPSPLMAALSYLKDILHSPSTEVPMYVSSTPILLPDGEEAHMIFVNPLPRTFRGRSILRVDTIPAAE